MVVVAAVLVFVFHLLHLFNQVEGVISHNDTFESSHSFPFLSLSNESTTSFFQGVFGG